MSFSDKLAVIGIIENLLFGLLSLACAIGIPIWIYRRQRRDAGELANSAAVPSKEQEIHAAQEQSNHASQDALIRWFPRVVNVGVIVWYLWRLMRLMGGTGPVTRSVVLDITMGVCMLLATLATVALYELLPRMLERGVLLPIRATVRPIRESFDAQERRIDMIAKVVDAHGDLNKTQGETLQTMSEVVHKVATGFRSPVPDAVPPSPKPARAPRRKARPMDPPPA